MTCSTTPWSPNLPCDVLSAMLFLQKADADVAKVLSLPVSSAPRAGHRVDIVEKSRNVSASLPFGLLRSDDFFDNIKSTREEFFTATSSAEPA